VVHDKVFDEDEAPRGSFFNDFTIRESDGVIFIADSSLFRRSPAIVVYDPARPDRKAKRRLANHRSVKSPPYNIVTRHGGKPYREMSILGLFDVRPHVDSIALDPTGEWLYVLEYRAAALHSGTRSNAIHVLTRIPAGSQIPFYTVVACQVSELTLTCSSSPLPPLSNRYYAAVTDTVLWRVPSHELSKVDFSKEAAADREDQDGRSHWRNEEGLDARWHNAVTPEVFGNKTMSDGIVVDLNGHVVITEMEYVLHTRCSYFISPFKYQS